MKWYKSLFTLMASTFRAISRLALLGLAAVTAFAFAPSPDVVPHGSPASVQTAYADPQNQNPTQPAANQNTAGQIGLDVLNGLVSVLFILINPLLAFASWLLSPDWTYGDVFNMRPILYKMWILTSNIVYTVFAIVLIVAAFMNIFGAGGGNYQMKSMLPRFVGGIILVPLSWFIVSAVLSISNILTASVLSLPYDIFTAGLERNNAADKILSQEIPNVCTFDLSKMNGSTPESAGGAPAGAGAAGSSTDAAGSAADGSYKCDGKITVEQLFSKSKGAYTILHVYAYGIFDIGDMQKISKEHTFKSIGDVIFGVFFGIIFFVLFGLLVIGIIVTLFTRVMHLWIFIILSPVFGLLFFLGKGGGGALKGWGIVDFVKLALVPVAVAAALSFGMLFVFTVMHHEPDNSDTSNDLVSMETPSGSDGTTQIIKIGGKQDPAFTFTLKGLPVSQSFNKSGAGTNFGLGVIGHVIVMAIAIGILWMAVKAATAVSSITEKAFKPIASFGDSLGKVLTQAPQYIPFIPAGKDKDGKKQMLSYQGIGGFGTGLENKLLTQNGQQIGGQFGDKVADAIGINQNQISQAIKEALQANQRSFASSTDSAGLAKAFNDMRVQAGVDFKDVATDSESRLALARMLEQTQAGAYTEGEKGRQKVVDLIKGATDVESFKRAMVELNNQTNTRLFDGQARVEDVSSKWNAGLKKKDGKADDPKPAAAAAPARANEAVTRAHENQQKYAVNSGAVTRENPTSNTFNINVQNTNTRATDKVASIDTSIFNTADSALANSQALLALSGLFSKSELNRRLSASGMNTQTVNNIMQAIEQNFGNGFFSGN